MLGSAFHQHSAVLEANLLCMPTIALVDGTLLFSGGGITFPIFTKTYALTRSLFFSSLFLHLFSFSSFYRKRFFYSLARKKILKPLFM